MVLRVYSYRNASMGLFNIVGGPPLRWRASPGFTHIEVPPWDSSILWAGRHCGGEPRQASLISKCLHGTLE